MSKPDIERLRALALVASVGPWDSTNDGDITSANGRFVVTARSAPVVCGRAGDYYACTPNSSSSTVSMTPENRAFVTACDPQTIIALCDAASEAEALRAEVEKLKRIALDYSEIISNHCIAMQSAVIASHLESPADGMRWIINTLFGPGLLPDMDEAKAIGGAQAWFNAKTAEEEARKDAIATSKPAGEVKGRVVSYARSNPNVPRGAIGRFKEH